jgi:hypothetical protein
MTGRTAAAIGSLTLALGSMGCVQFIEIPVEVPIQAKIDVSRFQRVLVAGFLAGGTKVIDPNTETARLLRSQLRTKSDMKVIDADVLSLVDEVDKGRPDAVAPPKNAEPKIKNAKDLQEYEKIFADESYWKKLGQEHQNPLIVTGSVLFTETSRSGMMSKLQESTDANGVSSYKEVQTFTEQKGFALDEKFVFIDGRTGVQLYSETLHQDTWYPATQNTPALSSYFELMDKILPTFLTTLSTQKIRGTRILIK